MNIRAHHLLCIKYFKGKGYSEDFVFNFSEVIRKLQGNPSIGVINHPDVICSSCPHNYNDKCVKKGPHSEEKVRRKDNIILNQLGIKSNEQIRAADAAKLVNLNLTKLKRICKDCQWNKYCN